MDAVVVTQIFSLLYRQTESLRYAIDHVLNICAPMFRDFHRRLADAPGPPGPNLLE